jgi:tetratricopeptide (TPR) repeat protein
MTESNPDGSVASGSGRGSRWIERGVLAAMCALVIGVYTYTAHSGYLASTSSNPADEYYNLLVQGFRDGQLGVKKEVPAGLARIPDPYDRAANSAYGLLDLSYYKGKLYLYFGVTPVLVLFWPYVALTGQYLLQKDAAIIFCAIGFLSSAGLLIALWRRYFAEVGVAVAAACVLAVGLATLVPVMLARSDVYEVSISCGYALVMLALVAIWKAFHESRTRSGWLAAASLAYGLAAGARPSLLPGAVVLLAPVVQAWRQPARARVLLASAVVPIALIGCGLLVYNALRFENPFEFGIRYQLSGSPQLARQFFSLRCLWLDFRIYFLAPARWSGRFPFVHDILAPPVPAGYGRVEHPFGVLVNIPLVWLALALPLAWRDRSRPAQPVLGWFVSAVVLLFAMCAFTLGLFRAACLRYQVEFVPSLVWLGAMGILSVERTLVLRGAGQPSIPEAGQASNPGPAWAGRVAWRRAARWSWILLLGFSVAFNLLASIERSSEAHYNLGTVLTQQGKETEAIAQYEQAVQLNPDYADAHNNLGVALKNQGHLSEAIAQYEEALRANPNFAEAYNNLGVAFMETGRFQEAIDSYRRALRIKPEYAEVHFNLAGALRNAGNLEEAVRHYEEAVRLKPEYGEAHNNLGNALFIVGRRGEAIEHFEEAVRLKPDVAEWHYNLGLALEQTGRTPEAVHQYEEALRIKPGLARVQDRLNQLRAVR